MNIKKAIEWQEAFKKTYKNIPLEKEAVEACDMAIKALNLMKQNSDNDSEEEMK